MTVTGSAYFPELMGVVREVHNGDDEIKKFDGESAQILAARKEMPKVLGREWNRGAFTTQQLQEWSKDERFSADARAGFASLATEDLKPTWDKPEGGSVQPDGNLKATELETLVSKRKADRTEVVEQAKDKASAQALDLEKQLDEAFVGFIKSNASAILNFQAPKVESTGMN